MPERDLAQKAANTRHAGKPQQRILVAGSARLDLYRFGGDSLQGRYFYLRLHPLSLAELGGHADALQQPLALGGFPEPFFKGNASFAQRWRLAYRERLVREEVTSLETVSDLGELELLHMALTERVGSPLSLNALREDLQVQHSTVARWVDILERLYGIFRLAPFTGGLRNATWPNWSNTRWTPAARRCNCATSATWMAARWTLWTCTTKSPSPWWSASRAMPTFQAVCAT